MVRVLSRLAVWMFVLLPLLGAAAMPDLAPFDAAGVRVEVPKGWRGAKDAKAKSNNWVFTPPSGQREGGSLHVMLGEYRADIRGPFQTLLDSLLKGAPGNPQIVERISAADGSSDSAVVEYGNGQIKQVFYARAAREQGLNVVVVFNAATAEANALDAPQLVKAIAHSAARVGAVGAPASAARRATEPDQARAHEQTRAIVSGSDSAVLIERVRPRDHNAKLPRGAPVADVSAILGKWSVGEAHSTMDIREATFDAITGSTSYEFLGDGRYVYVYQKTLVNPPFSSGMQMTESGRYSLANSTLRLQPDQAQGWVYNLNSKKQSLSERSPPPRSYDVRSFANGIVLTGGCSKYQRDFDSYCKSGKALDFPMRPADAGRPARR